MSCYICKDEVSILNKICECEDSLVCGDCLSLNNENINDPNNLNENRLKCCICRRYLKFNYCRSSKYYTKTFFFFIIKFIALLSDIGPIIYTFCLKDQIYPNSLYVNRDYFLISSMIQVIFLKYMIKYILINISKFNNINDEIKYTISFEYCYIFISNIFLGLLTLINNNSISSTYTLLILLPLYYIPFFSLVIVSMILNLHKVLEFNTRIYSHKKIQVRQIIKYSNSNSNSVC